MGNASLGMLIAWAVYALASLQMGQTALEKRLDAIEARLPPPPNVAPAFTGVAK